MNNSEARFTINVKDGLVELEGKENFVDKHLEKFEEIFKMAIKEAVKNGLEQKLQISGLDNNSATPQLQVIESGANQVVSTAKSLSVVPHPSIAKSAAPAKHTYKPSPTLPPIPVDLKANESKIGLRDFYAEKKPLNHYEKAAVFAYYLSKFNKQEEIKYGEILSCYEEVNEKKPSVIDIVKNSIRYKGWLEQGSDKYSARLTISGENFVKFDLPQGNGKAIPSSISLQQQQQTLE